MIIGLALDANNVSRTKLLFLKTLPQKLYGITPRRKFVLSSAGKATLKLIQTVSIIQVLIPLE